MYLRVGVLMGRPRPLSLFSNNFAEKTRRNSNTDRQSGRQARQSFVSVVMVFSMCIKLKSRHLPMIDNIVAPI